MLEKIKNILKNKKVLLGVGLCAVLIIAIIILLIVNSTRLTKLEKVKITEFSDDIINYADEIAEHTSDDGKYINFAMEYLYAKEDKKEYSDEEILDVINSNFDVKYDKDKLSELGISELMAGKGITFDSSTNKYKYENPLTVADIANTAIVKYELKSIKKVNKNKFKVKYDRLVVERPYEILNYYNDYNISQNQVSEMVEDDVKKVDLTDLIAYLHGDGKLSNVKKLISKESIEKYGKIDGSITITYVIKKDKLLISEIK